MTRDRVFINLRIFLVLVLGLIAPEMSAADPGTDEAVPVEGGTFLMGTERGEIAGLKSRHGLDFPGVFENEAPAHEVTVGDFRIDRYEVSNGRFAGFVTENRAWRPDILSAEAHNGHYLQHWQNGEVPVGKADHPVVFITWAAAQSYCRWRGGRLPTESEWEYAARAGDDREFPWGDEMPSPDRANYYADGIDDTTAVGNYAPNDLGLYDLAGNVWEFQYDEWQPEYPEDAQTDPLTGGEVSDNDLLNIKGRRAVRGASFSGAEVNLRTRWRDSHVVDNAVAFVGFRCVYPE